MLVRGPAGLAHTASPGGRWTEICTGLRGAPGSAPVPRGALVPLLQVSTGLKPRSVPLWLFPSFFPPFFFRAGSGRRWGEGWGGRAKVEMCCFAQVTCLHVIQKPRSAHRGSERCPIRSRRTQLGGLKRNTVATLKEVLSLGCYGVESQQTPLPRQKYRAIVPGRWAPRSGHFRSTPWNHIKGKGSRGKAAETGMAQQAKKGESSP